jgi:hypothetical protein
MGMEGKDGLDSAASAQLAIIYVKTAKGDGLVKTKTAKKRNGIKMGWIGKML